MTATPVAAGRPGTGPGPAITGRAGFADVISSEWMKIRTVRSTFWTLIALFAGSSVISLLITLAAANSYAKDLAEGKPDSADIVLAGLAFVGQIAAYVLGVMTISAEYSTGGIRTTLTAMPRRVEILVAKAILLAVIVFVIGLVTAFVCFYLGNIPLHAKHVGINLSYPGATRAVFGSALYLAGLSMFGLALGFLLRHTAGAITIGLALIFIIGNLFTLIPGSVGHWLYKVMPGNAGGQVTSFGETGRNPDKAFAPWTGFTVFLIEVVVLLIVGAILFERRDA
ncbi:ABC transporter permease subunit [Catenulispora sp. NF23]|uniref:ABC transporter permease subunit n=1 Tax=Catenulispora pinistramenti TaxID=2705254 RepID=A0ABS5L062_9ACTN|nr:ABC transporter permease subunit [Catenulispora pinistramenti]MBS2537326.1 ABC transporter permease subunit [Catenulispora pinistramenti]MBS2551720.1 ABC transporter permease subunit [Catenulispora pinistramenti]